VIKCIVKEFNPNTQTIEDYDILRYREDDIKKLKKKSATKVDFARSLREEFMRRFRYKSEHELIIARNESGKILLSPWCGCRDNEKATIDVTDDHSQLDWSMFAAYRIGNQIFKHEAKIDVYDQIMFLDRFDKLVDTLWTTRLKYERDNPKFHQ